MTAGAVCPTAPETSQGAGRWGVTDTCAKARHGR